MRRLLLLVVLVVAGCGVASESNAHRVPDDDVPFELLAPPTTVRPTTTSTSPDTSTVEVYFAAGDSLVPVEREIERPIEPLDVVEALAAGPDESEQASGITSHLPEDGGIESVTLTGGVATVETLPSFATVPPERQRLALAQVVFTLSARPGVGKVSFAVDGQPVDVPVGDGTLTSAPVSREDYPVVVLPS